MNLMLILLLPDYSIKGIHVCRRLISSIILFLLSINALNAQQCTLPSRIFLPTADEVELEQFGWSVDIHDQYMVAGLSENSNQQVASGRALVYKLDVNNKWVKIAELTPSDPGKFKDFGRAVSIFGNSIVIFGREYNDDGWSRGKLYVFEKADGEEWTSGNEDYIIAKPFGDILEPSGFGEFELHGNELITLSGYQDQTRIEVYIKSGGIFNLSQSITPPVSSTGLDNFGWHLAVSDNFFAISAEQFRLADNSSGAAFVYEKNGTYTTTPALLRSSEQTFPSYRAFGLAIAVHKNTLVIRGIKPGGSGYDQAFYVFERPTGGWVNASQPFLLESPGYLLYDAVIGVNENYIFGNNSDYRSVVVFKKPAGGWSSSATRFLINDLPGDKSRVGAQVKFNDTHLVVGCPAKPLQRGTPEESLVDYYSPTGTWESVGPHQQVITESTINATYDFFGEAFSVYNDQLCVTAKGDDEQGIDTGVVYVFDTQKQGTVPDQKIFNPEDENDTGFGSSLAMGDRLMFIGAPFKDSVGSDGVVKFYNIGKVYVYRQTSNGWVYSSQIVAPSIKAEVTFGQQVVWSKGYCAVTEFYTGSSESIGRVHIYKENKSNGKFNYIATLDPSTHLRFDYFGQSMVMTDSMMVIGTGNPSPDVRYRNSVYIFKKKGEWKNATEDARLTSSDVGLSDRYGASVSMYGDYIVVGAPYSPGFETSPGPRTYIIPGAAYIYKKPPGGWKGTLTEIAKLTPRDPIELGTFGSSVVIDHNDIFIGSPHRIREYNVTDTFVDTDNTLFPGKVYHFTKPSTGEWVSTNQEHRQIFSFEPEKIDGYGAFMFVSDRYLYVGAMVDDTESGYSSGSVQTMMQLPVIDEMPVLCSDQPVVKLLGFPKNGTWSGRGITATGIFSPQAAGPGIHTITYEHSGCSTSIQIEVKPGVLTITDKSDATQTKCVGKSIPLIYDSNESPESYAWYYKETLEGEFSKIDSLKEAINTNKPGWYEVRIERVVCPARTEAFTIIDEDPVAIEIDPVPTVCDDEKVQLTATPTTGHWNGPGVTVDGNFDPVDLQDGVYNEVYEIITSIGCHWKDSIMVQVDKLKQPALQHNGDAICGDRPVQLQLTNVDGRSTIKWYGRGSELAGHNTPSLNVSLGGEYYAEVIKASCSLTTSPVKLDVVVDSLFVPNVLTANNDAVNDYFEVISEGIDDFHLFLLNRYGQVMFESTDASFKWPAESAPAGVYYWRITYTTCANEVKEEKGWVHVIK